MKRMITKSLALVALVGAMTAYSTAKAEATLVAYICDDAACDGVGDLTSVDGDGNDGSALPNLIILTGAVGDYDFTLNVAQNLGNGLDLNYTATNFNFFDAGDVWLWVVDTGFTGSTINGTLGGTHDSGSVTAYICGGDDGNQAPPNSGPCVSGTDSTPLPTAINLSLGAGGSFAYAIGVKISDLGAATIVNRTPVFQTATGDFRTEVIPEPLTLSLLGLGLAGVATRRRRA